MIQDVNPIGSFACGLRTRSPDTTTGTHPAAKVKKVASLLRITTLNLE
jgi:hypothetical protein